MLKRLTVALAALFALAGSAFGAGVIPFSLSQQLDQYGQPLSGGFLYLIQAGTTSTPQNCYQDSALTIALPNPIVLDSAGRIPQFFCADGTIKVRLTDKNGVTQVVADNIQVTGASSGSGGGGTVDPTTVLSTGDLKVTYGTGVLSGFVRANGRTIGSATSGATERANADCEALFEYLWGADSNLVVSGGRGVSAAADWAANKTIALPDFRGRAIAGLDDMGNSAAGRLTSTYFGTSATVLGAAGFSQDQTLVTANLPPYTPSGTTTVSIPSSLNGEPPYMITPGGCCVGLGGTSTGATSFAVGGDQLTSSFSGSAQGGTSTAFAVGSPEILATFYIKL